MSPGLEQRVVEAARGWLGTPYHHAADIKGVGVDCAMIIVRVFADLGLIPQFDPRPYPPDWHLHRGAERYLGWVRKYADPVRPGEPIRPGDLVMFRFARAVSHGGIVETIEPETIMIHADRDAGCVERNEVRRWEDRVAGYWRVRA
jgi:NlpC/P60 family putative phage cell wall peptidase